MSKKMIIKGVGALMAKRLDKDGGAQVVKCGTLQDLKFDFNIDIEDIFGGDGLFAIDTLIKEKSIEITATDAKFDLDAVSLMLGCSVQEQVQDYVWVLNEQTTIDAVSFDVAPAFASTLAAAPDFQVRIKDSNKLLKQVVGAPAAADEFQLDTTVPASPVLVFHSTLGGEEVILDYKRTETVDMTDILAEEVPFPVRVIHHGSFLQKDGSYQGVEIELFSCIARGSFSIDAQRVNASASQIQLKVVDPERVDGKLGSIKRYSSTTKC